MQPRNTQAQPLAARRPGLDALALRVQEELYRRAARDTISLAQWRRIVQRALEDALSDDGRARDAARCFLAGLLLAPEPATVTVIRTGPPPHPTLFPIFTGAYSRVPVCGNRSRLPASPPAELPLLAPPVACKGVTTRPSQVTRTVLAQDSSH